MAKKEAIVKARSYKRSRTRERKMSAAKFLSAKEAIGKIEKNTDTYIWTFGQFSLIDAMLTVLDQTGPATVDIGTWVAADYSLERTHQLMLSGEITRLRMIVDYSFDARQPEFCHMMREHFGEDSIRAMRTHAKFLLIRSDTHDVFLRTSMNLNENPRLENLEISEDRAFCEYWSNVVDEIFRATDKEKRVSRLPGLEIPDDYPFHEVEADTLKRSSINEASYSHTIKKL